MSDYIVESISSLRLFGQLQLTEPQMALLPKGAMDPVLQGFSRIINRHIRSLSCDVETFAARTTADDRLELVLNGEHVIQAGRLKDDPKLLKAMRKLFDAARIRIPEAFIGGQRAPVAVATAPEIVEAKSRFVEWLSVGSDVNSVARNSMIAAGGSAVAVAVSGFFGGLASVAVGQSIANRGSVESHNAKLIGDREGEVNGKLTRGIGSSFTVAGASMVTGFLPGMLKGLPSAVSAGVLPVNALLGPNVTAALGVVGGLGLFVLGGFMLAQTYYNWGRLSALRDELTGILDNGFLTTEEKAAQGLGFLSQQFSLTEGELIELKEKHPEDSSALKLAIQQRIEVKAARLLRHVGKECATKIINEVAFLQSALRAGDRDALQKAIDLLEEVDYASYKTRVKQAIELVLSLLYMTVGILSVVIPLGQVVPLLFVIGAAIFILVDSTTVNRGVAYLASKVHGLANRDFYKMRWGQAIRSGKVDLVRLKRALNEALVKPTTYFMLNGERIESFDLLQKKLRLEALDFNRQTSRKKLSLRQLRGVQFMEKLEEQMALGANPRGVRAAIESMQVYARFDPRSSLGSVNLVNADYILDMLQPNHGSEPAANSRLP